MSFSKTCLAGPQKPPRQQARVEHTMAMLRQRSPSILEIALACDFFAQSHFTRVFVQHVGLPPDPGAGSA